MDISQLEYLDKLCVIKNGKKQFRDRSDAIRTLLQLGLQLQSILDLHKDPKKKEEFELKFQKLLHTKDVEKSMETMTEDQLNTIIFLATNQKDKRVQQLLLEIKRS